VSQRGSCDERAAARTGAGLPGAAIAATGLARAFSGRRAVDGVDIALRDGDRLAVVGPNGAGKSTLLRILATLLTPDSGTLSVGGFDIPAKAKHARGIVGYLGHAPLLYLDLTAWQNLELFADLHGVPDAKRRIEHLLDEVGLLTRAFDTVRTFSRGMAQRLGLARVLLHEPRLLLLDEPHVGLDAPGAVLLDRVLDVAHDTHDTRALVMVTHDLDRALAHADRVMVMRAGRIALEQPTSLPSLRARYEEIVA